MVDRERVERFLRTLVGSLTVAWLAVALFSPPKPFTFLLWLVPAWVIATAGAWWLVFRDGWARLEASPLFDPRTTPSKATLLFVGVAALVKVLGTAGANVLFGQSRVGYGLGVSASVLALVVAYGFAFWASEFLRTLLGILTVGTVVPGIFLPSVGLLAGLAVLLGWLLAPVATVWLVAFDGYDHLRRSDRYRPRAPAAEAATAFVALVLAFEALTTLGARAVLGPADVDVLAAVVTSVLAVVAAYWIVYRVGGYGALRAWYVEEPTADSAG